METIVRVTPKMIAEANSYLPIALKAEVAEKVANRCRNAIWIGAESEKQEESERLPTMYAENAELKARFLLGTLAKAYLRIEFDGANDEEYLLSRDDYDRLAGSHLLNQIERMKSDKEARDKCFDILQDYKALEKMANAELYGTLQVQNDPVNRFIAYMQASSSPEALEQAKSDLERLRDEITQYAEQKGSGEIGES